MNEYQEIPESYEAETEDIEALYLLLLALLWKSLQKLIRLPQSPTATDLTKIEKEVTKEIQNHFVEHNKKVMPLVSDKISKAYAEGISYSRESMSQENKLIEEKESEVEDILENLSDSHSRRLNKMITQSQEDLLKATHNTEGNIKRLVRKAMSKEMANAGANNRIDKRSNMALRFERQLREQFLKAGFKNADVAIIDKANRKWKLRTYSEMAVRTKMNMAYIDAIREEALNDGTDLAIISTKPDTHDECLNYEGMIISLNGRTAGYLTYEEIKKSKKCFHPNCGHFVRPVGGIEWIPANVKQKHERQMFKYRSK